MIKVKSILDEILFEKKKEGVNIFYNINSLIQAWQDDIDDVEDKEVEKTPSSEKEEKDQEENKDQEIQTSEPSPAPVPAQELNQSYEEKGNVLNEDILDIRTKGEVFVPEEDIDAIRSIDDILIYLSKQKKRVKITDKIKTKPKKLINSVIIEIVLALVNNDQETLKKLLGKGDKVFVDIDYGKEKESSVGISVVKNPGTFSISLNMKKDGKIVAMPFDKILFNKNLIDLRNELVG
jgi:hypothetical protein